MGWLRHMHGGSQGGAFQCLGVARIRVRLVRLKPNEKHLSIRLPVKTHSPGGEINP